MTTLFIFFFFGIAGLIGLWALVCLVSALIQKGPVALIKGYFSALSGDNKPDEKG